MFVRSKFNKQDRGPAGLGERLRAAVIFGVVFAVLNYARNYFVFPPTLNSFAQMGADFLAASAIFFCIYTLWELIRRIIRRRG